MRGFQQVLVHEGRRVLKARMHTHYYFSIQSFISKIYDDNGFYDRLVVVGLFIK